LPPPLLPTLGPKSAKEFVVWAKDGKEKFLDMGLLATGTTPTEMTEIMKTSCAAWDDAVKRAGVEPE
jgi:hypothetical protein